jgi:cytochrome c-type biogenesis protein
VRRLTFSLTSTHAGNYGKQVFGLILVITGSLIATGLDKSLEAWLLDRSPDWLTHLTTRF